MKMKKEGSSDFKHGSNTGHIPGLARLISSIEPVKRARKHANGVSIPLLISVNVGLNCFTQGLRRYFIYLFITSTSGA